MKLKKILLTTDFSESARQAYATATALAKRFDATLHLVHVAESMPPYFFLHGMGIRTDVPQEPYLDELEKHLEQERAFLEGVTVETKLLYHGHPYEAVCDYIKDNDIDLTVLSTHGHSAIGYLFLGSFAQKVVRHSRAPVLAYRHTARGGAKGEDAGYAPREVLVPYDFSENASAVIPLLRYLGEQFGPKFTFLYVQDPLPQFVDAPMGGDLATHLQRAIEEAPQRARELFDELRDAELSGLNVRLEIRKGAPQKEIVHHAEESKVDLILLSTHGWSGLKHYFLGSVAETVLRKAPCSVLIVRPRDAREG